MGTQTMISAMRFDRKLAQLRKIAAKTRRDQKVSFHVFQTNMDSVSKPIVDDLGIQLKAGTGTTYWVHDNPANSITKIVYKDNTQAHFEWVK